MNGDGRRCADGALPRRWLAVDLDRIDAERLPDVRMWFTRFSGCGWPTHSSTPEVPRERAMIELDREVTRAEGVQIGRVLARDLEDEFGDEVVVDPSTFRAEQPMFVPPAGATLARFLGDPLDVDRYLADAAGLPPERPPATGDPLADVTAGEGLHEAMARFTARQARDGLTAAEIEAAATQVLERARPTRGARVDDFLRTGELARLVNGAVAKYARPRDFPAVERIAADVQSLAQHRPVEPIAPERSDDQLAVEFVGEHGDSFRWSPGIGWLVNEGPAWSRDDCLQRFDAARIVCRRAAAGAGQDTERRRVASAKTVAAVLTLAQADPRIVVPTSEWDAPPLLLNTPGGVVDLATGEQRARGASDYFTQVTRASPDFEARCPLFDRFMTDVFGDAKLVEFMQRLLGYTITGARSEQALFFWHGQGANGKSTLLDLVHWLLGSYAIKLPAAALMVSRSERHPTELAQLRGKRLAISSELEEGQFWNEALIKELTGDTVLSARFMRQDFFEFAMTQKHVIVGNHRPRLRGGDPAMARRLVLVPFSATFGPERRDPAMLDKLKGEAPAILAWLVRGAALWRKLGLQLPERVKAASAGYFADHDDLQLWIDELCARDGEGISSELYRSFADWKQTRGERPPAQSTWGERVRGLPGVTARKASSIRYVGLRLRDAELSRVRCAR